MRAHVTDSSCHQEYKLNSSYLQPLDISMNRAFKVALSLEGEDWMTRGEKAFTKTGCMQRASFTQVCVEPCQNIHHHQQVSKGWTSTR